MASKNRELRATQGYVDDAIAAGGGGATGAIVENAVENHGIGTISVTTKLDTTIVSADWSVNRDGFYHATLGDAIGLAVGDEVTFIIDGVEHKVEAISEDGMIVAQYVYDDNDTAIELYDEYGSSYAFYYSLNYSTDFPAPADNIGVVVTGTVANLIDAKFLGIYPGVDAVIYNGQLLVGDLAKAAEVFMQRGLLNIMMFFDVANCTHKCFDVSYTPGDNGLEIWGYYVNEDTQTVTKTDVYEWTADGLNIQDGSGGGSTFDH